MNATNVSLYNRVIDSRNVVHVYSGKAYACMCGCKGNHRYASSAVEAQSKSHGYIVTGSDRAITSIVNKINNAPVDAQVEYDSDAVHVTYSGRTYVAWFK
jgi:hypothetical protein